MDKLKTQPLVRSSIFIYFDPTLEISDNRSIFYKQIKNKFSQILHPEIKALRYDMGDIDLYDPEEKKVIGYNTGSFKFEDYSYEKIDTFLETLNKNFAEFSKIYNITAFNYFNLIYENIVVINPSVGSNFNDYFTITFDIKSDKTKEFLAGEGTFVYKVNNGLLSVNIVPVINKKRETEKFKYNLGFMSNQAKLNIAKLLEAIKEAHSFIEDIFEKSLTEKYFYTLK